MIKAQRNLTISTEHADYLKANWNMSPSKMAEVLGISLTLLYNNKAVIRRSKAEPEVKEGYFDFETYRLNLSTI